MQSRLSRRIENQNKKAFLASFVGIVIIVFLLLKFGLPFLANVSYYIAGNKDSEQEKKEGIGFISPPVFDALPTATNSAIFVISGSAPSKTEVILYLNDDLYDTVHVDEDGSFEFRDVKLIKGKNEIKTKTKDKDKESSYSQVITVTYANTAPNLSVDSPSDGKSYSKDDKNAVISGKTDPGVKITVNGLWAIVDASGGFTYTLPLQSGENKITIIATDEAGNETKNERKVTYSP